MWEDIHGHDDDDDDDDDDACRIDDRGDLTALRVNETCLLLALGEQMSRAATLCRSHQRG